MQLAETIYFWTLMMSACFRSLLEKQSSFESKLLKKFSVIQMDFIWLEANVQRHLCVLNCSVDFCT